MRKSIVVSAGIVVGGLSGFLYWYYVGCLSGTCAITSSPVNSTLYGIVMGGLLFSMFQSPSNKKRSDHS